MTRGSSDAESRWLLRFLDWAWAAALICFSVVAFIYDWPAGRLGNAYQLVGLLFAALALPVLSPWLAAVEVRLIQSKEATRRRIKSWRHRLRLWWARLRHKTIPADMRGGSAAMSGGSAILAVGHRSVDRKTVSERDWLAFLNDELDALREQVRALHAGREEDRADVGRRLNALRVELQEHTLAVTREGWDYIATGAVLTGLGIVLTLV